MPASRSTRPISSWRDSSGTISPEDTGRASYELMTQVALTTTLFRVARTQATTSRVDGANGAPRRQA